MGGCGRIYYASISRYANDNQIALEPFVTFIQAMDDEYISHIAKLNKESAAESAQE